jgi:hypothetical protein
MMCVPCVIQVKTPFPILGLLAFEFWAMHFVELKRWQVRDKCGAVHDVRWMHARKDGFSSTQDKGQWHWAR